MTDARAARHRAVAAELASWSDLELRSRLAAAELARGIGGATLTLTVAGVPVFVKLIALTELERAGPELSTANLFELPTWYQWGVGSAGFGAGREVAAQHLASDWTAAGRPNFPYLHRQRVLTNVGSLLTPDQAGAKIDRAVEFWAGSPAVRSRLTALAQASSAIVLFSEHIPHTMRNWLATHLSTDGTAAWVEHELIETMRFLRSQGCSHFDAHLDNLLTDGEHVYLSDFGLASAASFELSGAERRFLAETAEHDLAYVVTELTNAVVRLAVRPAGPAQRNDYLRQCARTGATPLLPAGLSAVVRRHAPVAVVLNDFYWQLHGGHPRTPYPGEAIGRALHQAGLSV